MEPTDSDVVRNKYSREEIVVRRQIVQDLGLLVLVPSREDDERVAVDGSSDAAEVATVHAQRSIRHV